MDLMLKYSVKHILILDSQISKKMSVLAGRRFRFRAFRHLHKFLSFREEQDGPLPKTICMNDV